VDHVQGEALSQKLLIVVLVVVVLIFLITLGMSGCQGSDKPNPKNAPKSVKALKGLQGKRFLTIGDKATTNCAVLSPAALRVNGSCTIVFQKRKFFNKSTRVAFVPNTSVRVVVQPKNGKTQDNTPGAFECYGTAVDHGGGTMFLSANNATLTLRRQPCPE
jgi:hypothetical protein